MSSDNPANQNEMARNRRGSVTQATFTNLFQRSHTVAAPASAFPGAVAMGTDANRRRLSITTLGITGSSPTNPAAPYGGLRRGSMSTNNSDSIDENAIDEDDLPRGVPTTPFTRRMSFGAQAMRNLRTGGNSPGSNDQGFNWSEQFRSRAESSVTGSRPSFSTGGSGLSSSPPKAIANNHHDRAKSVSDMPAPPAQAAAVRSSGSESRRQKPDPFQERILKGDFYMD